MVYLSFSKDSIICYSMIQSSFHLDYHLNGKVYTNSYPMCKARKEKGGIFEDGNWSVAVFITVGLDDRLKHIKVKMGLNCSIYTKR